jgi:hypothetical protein
VTDKPTSTPVATLAKRQRLTFLVAMGVLLVCIVGAFLYETRADESAEEIANIAEQERAACLIRNGNVDALRESLLAVAYSTDTYTRSQILHALEDVRKADCDRFIVLD